jgi:hypothetical protein
VGKNQDPGKTSRIRNTAAKCKGLINQKLTIFYDMPFAQPITQSFFFTAAAQLFTTWPLPATHLVFLTEGSQRAHSPSALVGK